MEVRVCPSCGTENKKSRSSCANCYASLANVPATQGAVSQPAAPPARTLSGAPMRSAQPQTSQRPAEPGPQSTRPQISSEPESRGSLAWLFILIGVVVVIGLVAFAGLKLRPYVQMATAEPKVPADKVVMSFLEAKKTHEVEKVKPFVSEASVEALDTMLNSKQAQSAGFTRDDAHNMLLWDVPPTHKELLKCDFTAAVTEDENAEGEGMKVVRVTLTPKPQPAGQPQDMSSMIDSAFLTPEADFVLVKEKAEWKVDFRETARRARKGGPMLFPK